MLGATGVRRTAQENSPKHLNSTLKLQQFNRDNAANISPGQKPNNLQISGLFLETLNVNAVQRWVDPRVESMFEKLQASHHRGRKHSPSPIKIVQMCCHVLVIMCCHRMKTKKCLDVPWYKSASQKKTDM